MNWSTSRRSYARALIEQVAEAGHARLPFRSKNPRQRQAPTGFRACRGPVVEAGVSRDRRRPRHSCKRWRLGSPEDRREAHVQLATLHAWSPTRTAATSARCLASRKLALASSLQPTSCGPAGHGPPVWGFFRPTIAGGRLPGSRCRSLGSGYSSGATSPWRSSSSAPASSVARFARRRASPATQ